MNRINVPNWNGILQRNSLWYQLVLGSWLLVHIDIARRSSKWCCHRQHRRQLNYEGSQLILQSHFNFVSSQCIWISFRNFWISGTSAVYCGVTTGSVFQWSTLRLVIVQWCYNYCSKRMVIGKLQIVSLAVYTVFAAYIFSRQHGGGDQIDMYFPIWTALEFVFYMGLLKVIFYIKKKKN